MIRSLYRRFGCQAILCAVSVNAIAHSVDPSLTQRFLKESSLVQLPTPVAEWDKSVREVLKTSESPVVAVQVLSSRYNKSPEVIAKLVELWAETTILSWKKTSEASQEKEHRLLDARFIALAKATRRDPLVSVVAAEAITNINRCNAETYRALVGAKPDAATAWSIADIGYCTNWLLGFSKLHPEKAAAILVRLAKDGELARPESLALQAYLAGNALQDHVTPGDYELLRNFFAARYIDGLFDIGLVQEGLVFFDALPEQRRRALMGPGGTIDLSVAVDGLAIRDKAMIPNLTSDLAAARYVLGNSQGSSEVGSFASQLEASRAQLRCWHDYVPRDQGGNDDCHSKEFLGKVALLDVAVFTPLTDPYDFLEYYYGDQLGGEASPTRGSGLWTQVLCKRLGTGRYASICEKAREFLEPWGSDRSAIPWDAVNEKAAHTTFRAVAGSSVTARADDLEVEITAAVGPKPKAASSRASEDSIDPLPSPFEELSLPTSMRTARLSKQTKSTQWPATFTPLPAGYSPVRVERAGERVVAISASQNLDPSGEVSAGGYWVHLSHDGGRSWDDPLYTGLAERFPYVVREYSKLPLFDRDTLNVEVEIEQLDTASITYPPVGLRSKRRATNRYLRIPIATLREDSDGDGIPDIVENHLLLDPHNPDSDGDGIPDGLDTMPNVPRRSEEDPTQGAMAAVIEKMFDVQMGPIIEGINTADNSDRLANEFKTIRMGHTLSLEHPIFIEGNAADFAAFNPSRVVLVYNDRQLAHLQQMTPDFHAVSLSPSVLNDAKDRGYVIWNTGWAGGTFRLVREGQKWTVFTISQWIS